MVAMSLDVIIDGPRPGPSDQAADAQWLALRRVMFDAEVGHRLYDPRRVLGLSPGDRDVWIDGRRRWLADLVFAGDSRVVVDVH